METNMRILVADDDPMARLGCKAVIERLGHTALTAQDGEEALRLLERGDTDLLLLDILMPRKDGLATLLDVKRRFPLVTVVAMSAGGARSFTDFLEVARRFGADRTLSKPFQPEELAGTVEECRAMAAGRP
jgi:CheY-like chemotaxis protein